MFWLATGSVIRGELPQAREVIATLLDLAEARNDRPMLVNAIRGLGMISLFMGHPVDARELTERAIEAFSASNETEKLAARAAGQDAGAAGLALMSGALDPRPRRHGSRTNGRRASTRRCGRTSAYRGLRLLLCIRSSRTARRAVDCTLPRRALPNLVGGTRISALARVVARHSGHLHGDVGPFSQRARGSEGRIGSVS
jgi:hypothetical protein